MSNQIDVLSITQKLYDELMIKSDADKLRAEGVAMLFTRLQEAVRDSQTPDVATTEGEILDSSDIPTNSEKL